MNDRIPQALREPLAEFVARSLGLHFPPERWPDLGRGIHAAAHELGFADVVACVHRLLAEPPTQQQLDVLAGNLTVGETYFFRDPRSFDLLGQELLPALVQVRRGGTRHLRLWCAGCCTGEEAYSLAIVVHRLLPDLRDWQVDILATDVNPRFLRKAEQGVYGEWSFRDAPAWLKGSYFTRAGTAGYAIRPDIQRMVTFAPLNLVQDIYPALLNHTNARDMILCRNVLMYFTAAQVQRVLDNLYHCLVEEGWLLLSASETASAMGTAFSAVQFDGTRLYRKGPPNFPVPAAPEVGPAWSLPVVALAPAPAVQPVPVTTGATDDALASVASPEEEPQPSVRDAQELRRLARDCANQGRLVDALRWCDQAVAAEKLCPAGHYLRAAILHEQGAWDEAERAWHRALYLDQTFVLAHFALGNLAHRRGRQHEATRHFGHALHLLRTHAQEDILPESDGLTAGRLATIITATLAGESVA